MEPKKPSILSMISFRGWVLLALLAFCILVFYLIVHAFTRRDLEEAKQQGAQSSVNETGYSVQAEQDAAQAPIVLTYKADNAAVAAQLEGLKDEIAKLPPSASDDVDPDLTRVVLTGLCADPARRDSPDCSPYREDSR